MLSEVILQLLIGVVDAELLEAVPFKVLKSEDVEDTDGQALERQTIVTARACWGR